MQDPFPPHTVLKILPVAHTFSDFSHFFNPFGVLQESPPPGLPAAWALSQLSLQTPTSHRCALTTQICLLLHKGVMSQTFSPIFLLPTFLIIVLNATIPTITNDYSLPPGLLPRCSDTG